MSARDQGEHTGSPLQFVAENMTNLRDIFIVATAKHHHLDVATLNIKHFERIQNIKLWELS
ncbi:MAG: hypothetical protein HQM12_18370 [SAR324 cluster bacterium]|nr:hypothetical protein [SAR324 cluster bacterium]